MVGAAARAERHALERLVLAEITLHRVGDLRRRGVAFADGEPADLRRRGDVALEQRRRHAEHVGDVVEAVARIVCGQEGRGIDVEREQIADRVLVLDAVHAVQRRASGIGTQRPRRDRWRSRSTRRRRRARRARDAWRRRAASCRRAPCGSPSPRSRRRRVRATRRRAEGLAATGRRSSGDRCGRFRSKSGLSRTRRRSG